MSARRWLIHARIDNEDVYFFALIKRNGSGPSDAAWTSERGKATLFQHQRAAVDTAAALERGEAVEARYS